MAEVRIRKRKKIKERKNGAEVESDGVRNSVLDLGLRRAFPWTFIVAAVKLPIKGVNFLTHYKLLVDLGARIIVDQVACLNVNTPIVCHEECESSIKTLSNPSKHVA